MTKPIPTSNELSAFAEDIRYFLEQTGILRHKRTKKTGDLECALMVTFDLLDPRVEPASLLKIIRDIWNDEPLGYGDDHLSEVLTPSQATIKFATTSPESDLAATGAIVINLSGNGTA